MIDAKTMSRYIQQIAKIKIWHKDSKDFLDRIARQIRYPKTDDYIWRINISDNTPLKFKHMEIDKRLIPDVICNIELMNNNENLLSRYEICIRIWSSCEKLSFDESRDSVQVKDILEKQDYLRVVYKCHFEKTSTKNEPKFHLQFGGIQRDGYLKECYWIPPNLTTMRFLMPPLDLILTIEMILVNFYPDIYQKEKSKLYWLDMIKDCEKMFLEEFYRKCSETLGKNTSSILNSFINE
ncbi:MAG: hypothetical protein HZR80_06485 [Candidatus Heimdallarchaeota archaeon]